jgi:hypothetical protein
MYFLTQTEHSLGSSEINGEMKSSETIVVCCKTHTKYSAGQIAGCLDVAGVVHIFATKLYQAIKQFSYLSSRTASQ